MSLISIQTNLGDFVIGLDHLHAPKSCENFLDYVKSGHYDGTIFHRVIGNFMIQGGNFKPGMVTQPTGAAIDNEAKNGLKNDKYAIAMARTSAPHSATDQFFINMKDNGFLDYPGQDGWGYAVFGKVVEGTDVIDAIAKVDTRRAGMHSDVPVDDVVILSAKVLPAPPELADNSNDTKTDANPNPVISVQVVPIIDDGTNVTAQPEGPTEATTGWGVYGRTKDGIAKHLKDFPDETQAMDYAGPVAAGFGVEIEPQLWKAQDDDELPEMSNDFNDDLLAVFSFAAFLNTADLSKYGEQVVAAQRQSQEAIRNLYLLLNDKVAEIDPAK